MSEQETKLRIEYNLPLEGNLCSKCLSTLEDKSAIDAALSLNSTTQASLGIDSSQEDKVRAGYVARNAKYIIAQIDHKLAERCFPEIDLKELPPSAYLGEKL